MAYNPYEAAKKITEEKKKWANAAANGQDGSAYEATAAGYYDELRKAGRDDVADKLQKSDLMDAEAYLKMLAPDYEDSAMGHMQKSNDVYHTGKAYGEDIKRSYDDVYKNNVNVNPVETGYGKSVMASYGAAADGAYGKALGGGIEDAYGAVDSYAAANANRQKAAMLSKGHGDILNYYNAISGRANEWAGSKASALSGNLSQLQGNVDADRADRQFREQSDVQKYLGELGLAGDVYAADASKDAALGKAAYDYEGTVYKADSDFAGTQYKADSDYAGTVYKADSGYAGQVYKTNNNGGNSGGNSGSKSGGDTSGGAGKSYATSISTLVNDAIKEGLDSSGNLQFPEMSDAVIKRLLDDPGYAKDAKEKLSDAYYEKTGRRVLSDEERRIDQLLRRVSNQKNAEDARDLVYRFLESGTVDMETAERLLKKAGYYTPDLEG